MSVRSDPASCLRLWRSPRYLRIPPLHLEFRLPLSLSSSAVLSAIPRLSRGISHLTYRTACAPFMPSNSEQRLHISYYSGCWHEISLCFLWIWSVHRLLTDTGSEILTAVYDPKAFIPHAASHRHAFAHWRIIQHCCLP